MVDFSKEALPFFNDFFTARFNDCHNIPQCPGRNLRIVITQQAFSRARNPDFRGISTGRSLRNMDVNRFQQVALVRPELHPIRTNLKNLRHCQILPLARIGESGAP